MAESKNQWSNESEEKEKEQKPVESSFVSKADQRAPVSEERKSAPRDDYSRAAPRSDRPAFENRGGERRDDRSYDRRDDRSYDRRADRSYDRRDDRSYDRRDDRSYDRRDDRSYDRRDDRSYDRRDSRSYDDRSAPFKRGGDGDSYGGKRERVATSPNETLGVFGLDYALEPRVFEEFLDTALAEFKGKYTQNLIMDRMSGQCKGFGFLEFNSIDDATAAKDKLKELEESGIGGRRFRVDFSMGKRRSDRPREDGFRD